MKKEKEVIEAEEIQEGAEMQLDQDAETPAENQPSIVVSLVGVKLMCEIIDLASLRGAFQPNEFSTIGSLYTELKKHLPPAPAPAPATTESEESEDGQEELDL